MEALDFTESIECEDTSTHMCEFCYAQEGRPRPVGQFTVVLKTITVEGTPKLACQSCLHKRPALRSIFHHSEKETQASRWQKLLTKLPQIGFGPYPLHVFYTSSKN